MREKSYEILKKRATRTGNYESLSPSYHIMTSQQTVAVTCATGDQGIPSSSFVS